jgi:multiple antibiotic resistance protein
MLAGPGSISLLIAFYSEHQETSEIIISVVAMVAVAIAIFIVFEAHTI